MKSLSLILLLWSSLALATEEVEIGHCGERPGLVAQFFTDLDEIRTQCINDAYDENRKKLLDEANELSGFIKKIDEELKTVAYKYDRLQLVCEHPNHPKNKVQQCRDLSQARKSAVNRMDTIMGWNERTITQKKNSTTRVEQITPPCPSKDDLAKIQQFRYFNQRMYQTWEKCVNMNAENYYN